VNYEYNTVFKTCQFF